MEAREGEGGGVRSGLEIRESRRGETVDETRRNSRLARVACEQFIKTPIRAELVLLKLVSPLSACGILLYFPLPPDKPGVEGAGALRHTSMEAFSTRRRLQ